MERAGRERMGLEEFCRVEYPRLVRMLGLHCGDVQVAEDLAQETLARLWCRRGGLGSLEHPEAWCRRVAFNLASSWARRQRLARRRPPAADEPEQPESRDGGFARAVAGLSPRQRSVMILRFYEDRSVADTARLLGVREGTVRALSAQAIGRLRADQQAVEELR